MILLSIRDKKISSFLRNGVVIDTSVIFEIICGAIATQRNTTDTGWRTKYEIIINLLQRIKIYNDWRKFLLTPHIMTETCSKINLTYNKDDDFKNIAEGIMAIVDATEEKPVDKKILLRHIHYKTGMKLEIGDLSIYAIADDFEREKKKVAILTQDGGFSTRYAKSPYVMVIDHRMIADLE